MSVMLTLIVCMKKGSSQTTDMTDKYALILITYIMIVKHVKQVFT